MVTIQKTSSPGAARWAGGLFLAIGALLLALAWHLRQQQQRFVAGARQAPGVVEALPLHTYAGNGGGRRRSYVPLVRFRAADGRSYLFEATSSATRPAAYAVGEAVAVYYDPAQPARAQLRSFMGQSLKWVFVAAFGLVFGGIGLGCLRLLARARPA